MKTSDFIYSVINGRTKAGQCSSIMFDGKHIYSYGHHYPLLININGKWILNDYGYSSTTAKHISWARTYADYIVALEPMNSFTNGYTDIAEKIETSAIIEIGNLKQELKILSKRAFKRKQTIIDRLLELEKTLSFIKKARENKPYKQT